MKRTVICALLVCAAVPRAHAGDNRQACVPEAYGLPGVDMDGSNFSGPPYWVSGWPGALANRVLDTREIDPRWVNAGGSSIGDDASPGTAMAPIEVRLLTSGRETNAEAPQYLYLSARLTVGDVSADRVVRIFLKATDTEPARVIRVLLRPDPGGAGAMTAITHCAAGTGTCGASTHFRIWAEDPAIAGTYLIDTAAPSWLTGSLRGWWDNTSGIWTVQLRIPVVAAGSAFSAGITASTQVAMDFVLNVAGDPVWYVWPRTLPKTFDTPLDEGADDDWKLQLPPQTEWGTFRSKTGVFDPPSGGPTMDSCESIRIETVSGLGVTHNPTASTDYGAVMLGNELAGVDSAGTPVRNEFVVRIKNDTSEAIDPNQIKAEFRIAQWGAQGGHVVGPPGSAWQPVPATVGTNPAFNTDPIPAGASGAIHFGWTLDKDQRCRFSVPTAADLADPTGCTAEFEAHQCIFVDLTGTPSLNLDFETRGTWNNFEFVNLSATQEKVTIDVRDLPIPPSEREVEVYLVGMARNMPTSVASGSTGASALAASAEAQVRTERERLAQMRPPIDPDVRPLPAPKVNNPLLWRELPKPEMPPAARYIAPEAFRRLRVVSMLAELPDSADPLPAEQAVVSELGPNAAAGIIPTLDVYVYYKDQGRRQLVPMTGFTYFLAHQGALGGYEWSISGADKLSPNVYRLRVKRDSAADVTVHLTAHEKGKICEGCCCKQPQPTSTAMSHYALPMIGVVAGVGLRRRRRRKE